MSMADLFTWVFLIIGFLLSLQGLWLVSYALWPNRVTAAAGRCGRNGVKCFLIGLPITASVVVLTAAGSQSPGQGGRIAGWALACLYLFYANVGAAGFVTHIGQRLTSPVDGQSPWRATVRGGIALELAYLVPVFGLLVIFPLSMVIGCGATTLSFFRPRRSSAPVDLTIERSARLISREPTEVLR